MLTIPRISNYSQFEEKQLLIPISNTPWEQYSNAPEACVKLAYIDCVGLLVQLCSKEIDLLATVTERDGMVCRNSCMEAFIDFAPEKGRGYINFEINPLAALHEAIGTSRHDRRFVKELNAPETEPFTTVTPHGWKAEFTVTEQHIAALYGKAPQSGDIIKANFYCCADDKSEPFYVTAFKIETPFPDYHRPEYFAQLTIE